MASKLKIIPLGGLGEIGKNVTAIEYGKDIIVIDCGMGFPEDDMYGVDIVIPDFTYLKNNRDRVRNRAARGECKFYRRGDRRRRGDDWSGT